MSTSERAVTKQEREITAFETLAEKMSGLSLTIDLAPAKKMFRLADAMNSLDNALTTDVLKPIMKLQGSRVGFRTDKDKDGGYPEKVVKEVVKEAILYGAYMTGNEVNIIAGGMYATKEHFMRKVSEIPGLTDLETAIGTPKIENNEAKVRCSAKWKMNGIEQTLGFEDKMPCVFTVRVYDRPGGQSVAADQAIGKATRKLYKRIYELATGSKVFIPDGDAADAAREVPAKVVDRAAVNLDDIKPGNAEDHKPVDSPVRGKKSQSTAKPDPAPAAQSNGSADTPTTPDEFERALAKLSLHFDERGREIDDMLRMNGVDMSLMDIPKDCADERIMREVVKIAKEF